MIPTFIIIPTDRTTASVVPSSRSSRTTGMRQQEPMPIELPLPLTEMKRSVSASSYDSLPRVPRRQDSQRRMSGVSSNSRWASEC